MTNANKQIKISSILYLISALLVVPFAPAIGSVLLILGIVLLSNAFLTIEELKKNKVSLIIIIKLSFILNIPAAIFLLITLDEISNYKVEKSNAPPATSESKRIDMLLKLGLAMVLVSGILFATTTWEIISNLVKVIALVGMGAAFIGLSKFSETTLKIQSTAKAYFILGLSFFLLTWVGIGYFGIISPWFSYAGEGSNLVYFITAILIAGCLYLINHKFKEKEYLYMGHMTMYVAAYHLFASFGLDLLGASMILCAISILINILPRNKTTSTVKDINDVASYLYAFIVLTQCFEANKYIVLVACIINLVNTMYLGFKNKTAINQVITAILSYVLLTIATLKLSIVSDNAILLFAVITIFSLFIKYQKFDQSKALVTTSQIVYNIMSLILLIVIGATSTTKSLIVSPIYLLINIINSLDLYKTKDQVDLRVQPLAIFAFYLSLMSTINEHLVWISGIISFSLTGATYMAIYHFSNSKEVKDYYFVFSIIAVVLTFLINLEATEIVTAIINTLLVTYLFFTRQKEAPARIILYIAILLNVLCSTHTLPYYGVSDLITNLITLAIFIVLTLVVKTPKLKTINYISVAIPLYNLVYMIDMADNLKHIVTNVFWLYILFLILKFFVKNKQAKDWVATVGIILIMWPLIFESDILIGIYIGALAIVLIFLAFNEEHYKKLFYTGIVITIVNIVVQLWEFWTKVPVYLYLLLVGIALIGFVTYKELNKKNHPEKYQPKPIENPQPQMSQAQIAQQPMHQPQQQENTHPQKTAEDRFQIVDDNPLNEQEPTKEENTNIIRFCPACGKKNNGGKFCGGCGRNLQI